MHRLMVRRRFAAAHQVKEAGGGCENLHGHTWKVQFTVEGSQLDDTGMLVDFRTLKRQVDQWIDRLDHSNLNETLKGLNPTSEHIAEYLYQQLGDAWRGQRYRLVGVTVWESDDSGAWYGEEERP